MLISSTSVRVLSYTNVRLIFSQEVTCMKLLIKLQRQIPALRELHNSIISVVTSVVTSGVISVVTSVEIPVTASVDTPVVISVAVVASVAAVVASVDAVVAGQVAGPE